MDVEQPKQCLCGRAKQAEGADTSRRPLGSLVGSECGEAPGEMNIGPHAQAPTFRATLDYRLGGAGSEVTGWTDNPNRRQLPPTA